MASNSVPSVVTVPVKSSWASKINWTQGIGMLATLGAVFGLDIPPQTQVEVIAGVQGVVAVTTWVIKTWFTKTVTPSSL